MSEFVDSEAEKSEGEGEEMEEDDERIGMMQQKKKRKAVHSDDEEEEDDDEQNVNDLIDDNPIEEDDSDYEESDGSRKRKKSDDEDELSDRLEDDDYDLIEENLGVKVQRKKFKRLKRIEDEDSDQEGSQGGDDRDAIANQLFGGSDNEEDVRREPVREETPGQYASEESEGEYSETDDFIVDDEGRPLKDRQRKRKPIFTDATLQEAQDIFGVDFDCDEFEKYDEEYYEEDEDEEGRTITREKKVPRRRRKAKSIYEIYEPHELERAGFTNEDNKIRSSDIPERMQLRSVPVTPADDQELDEEAEWIYKTEFIKRDAKVESLKKIPDSVIAPVESEANWDDDWDKQTMVPGPAQTTVGQGADDNWEDDGWEKPRALGASAPIPRPAGTVAGDPDNWEDEEWERPSKQKSATIQEKPVEESKPQIIPKIRKALEFMRNRLFEVPFIAFYRKEYVLPDLTINDLWKIYRLDARFCSLKNRKGRLIELFKNMREHQTDLIMARPDDPISDSMRLITDEDIERIKAIKTAEELKDMYPFFTLYYADEVPAMKEGLIRKRKEERQRARDAAQAARAAAAAERGDGENGDDGPPPDEVEPEDFDDSLMEESSWKRKIGSGAYGMCKKMGIETYVKKFGLSPEKFAENLRDNYQRHEVDQYPTDPIEAAREMMNDRLKEPDEILKAAKFMMATQISREPIVRRCVREVFFERATISCYPTKKGQKEIDEAHPCFTMKYLHDKPVRDLTGDQFLKLTLAEEDRLLVIQIGDKIKGMTSPSYIEEVKQLFQKDEFSKNVQDWNTLRGECIEFAFEKLLYPVLRKELRAKLAEEAKDHVLKTCSSKLYNWLQIAPYEVNFPDEDEEEWDTSRGIRVLAVAYVPDYEQASFACLVNPDGEPSDYLRLQNIIKNKNAHRDTDRQEKEADLLAVKNFIRNKKPHLIVIGGESREGLMIQQDVRDLCTELVNEDAFPKITVELVDNSLAKVYANSIKSQSDFRDYPLLLRQAVSLARRMQDPLIEFSQLCTADEEILCMRFHTLQDHVPKEELLEHLHLEFVNRTCEVGVDINRAVTFPHTSSVVQFIAGLGPSKASGLLQNIRRKGGHGVENRHQLHSLHMIGPIVFFNCAGFIKIDTTAFEDSEDTYVEVLDGTRVHPESYDFAKTMARDALYDDVNANLSTAVEEFMEDPDPLKLDELSLEAFACELKKEHGEKLLTLFDIREELKEKYKDLRVPFTSPDENELFHLLTKETPETLYLGKLVVATVLHVVRKKPKEEEQTEPVRDLMTGQWTCSLCNKRLPELKDVWEHVDRLCPGPAIGVFILLDNGLTGLIPTDRLSDKPVINPEERVFPGQKVHCRVTKICINRFSVECSSRTSDLRDEHDEWKPKKDEFYDKERESIDLLKTKEEEELRNRNKRLQVYVKRVIVHPCFRNIAYKEAETMMEKMDQGEMIVRPSSKGENHLTVTWKVANGVCQHIDVREEGKAGAFSLGQSLWIGQDEFEDIDEILARHVAPMAAHARDIINYKYFTTDIGGDVSKTEEFLKQQQRANNSKIHYIFQASKEYPGKFMLSYLPRNSVAHEFVTVVPNGFRYREEIFETLDELLYWFKHHYKDPPPSRGRSW